jgi:DNA-binding NarL/FixJ family response regulator
MDRIHVALWVPDDMESEGLQQIIAASGDMTVCCHRVISDSTDWALGPGCSNQRVDVAVMLLPIQSLDLVVPTWRCRYPQIPMVAILKEPWHWSQIVRILQDGVTGLTSAGTTSAILSMIRLAAYHTGGVDRDMVQQILTVLQGTSTEYHLTSQDCRIWELIAQGLSNPQIATRCDLSLSQVKHSVHRIFQYLKVHSRYQAIALYCGTDLKSSPEIDFPANYPAIRKNESIRH